MGTNTAETTRSLYEHVREGAENAGVFAEVRVGEDGVRCLAQGPEEEVFYRVYSEGGTVWVALETDDRWISGSIEGDLVGTGDKLDELLEEEIVDLGHHDAEVGFQHLRSPEKVYVFRSPLSTPLDAPEAPGHALIWLLGYEIVFRELGDMSGDDD